MVHTQNWRGYWFSKFENSKLSLQIWLLFNLPNWISYVWYWRNSISFEILIIKFEWHCWSAQLPNLYWRGYKTWKSSVNLYYPFDVLSHYVLKKIMNWNYLMCALFFKHWRLVAPWTLRFLFLSLTIILYSVETPSRGTINSKAVVLEICLLTWVIEMTGRTKLMDVASRGRAVENKKVD